MLRRPSCLNPAWWSAFGISMVELQRMILSGGSSYQPKSHQVLLLFNNLLRDQLEQFLSICDLLISLIFSLSFFLSPLLTTFYAPHIPVMCLLILVHSFFFFFNAWDWLLLRVILLQRGHTNQYRRRRNESLELYLERRSEFDCILAHTSLTRRMRSGSFIFGSCKF